MWARTTVVGDAVAREPGQFPPVGPSGTQVQLSRLCRRWIVSISSLASGIAWSCDAAALGSGTGVANQAMNSTRAGWDRSRAAGSVEDATRAAGPGRGRRRVVDAEDDAERSAATVGAAREALSSAGHRADPGVGCRGIMDARQVALIAATVGATPRPRDPAGLGAVDAPRRPVANSCAVAAKKDAEAAASEVHASITAVSERGTGLPVWCALPESARAGARRTSAQVLALHCARRAFLIATIEIRDRPAKATVA